MGVFMEASGKCERSFPNDLGEEGTAGKKNGKAIKIV